jgi:predicted neutral ceramidase superfamily lipid hydrolase
MKNNVLKNGLLGGLAVSSLMLTLTMYMKYHPQYEPSTFLVFLSIILANVFVVLGILQQRRANSDSITLGKAFQTGLLISLITSTIYVVVWLIIYYNFFPDFMERYGDLAIKKAKPEDLAKTTKEINQMKEWYKSPILVILLTYMEVFPTGIVVSFIASLALKKKKITIE